MSDQDSSPAAVFAVLRNQFFHSDPARLAPVTSSNVGSGTGPEVVGVAMELAIDTGSSLVLGLRDGTASMYHSTGGGWIGGQGYPQTAGRVRFSIFTTAGIRAAEADEAELMSARGELLPLFAAAQESLQGFGWSNSPSPATSQAM